MAALRPHVDLAMLLSAAMAETPDEPPPLSDEYHHARRNLNFASALLLGGELLGIRPTTNHELDGFHFEILSPGAAVWLLILVVVFFWIRLQLEWLQCSASRRQLRVARTDYWLSRSIAIGAIGLFAYQRAGERQLFDAIAKNFLVAAFVVGGLVGVAFATGAVNLWNSSQIASSEDRRGFRMYHSRGVAIGVVGIALLMSNSQSMKETWSIIAGAIVGCAVAAMLVWTGRRPQPDVTSATVRPPISQS